MKCLFEVNDLAAASPATVSRIGVVYVTSSLLGWFPFVQTWSAITLDDAIPPQIKSHILSRFEEFVLKPSILSALALRLALLRRLASS